MRAVTVSDYGAPPLVTELPTPAAGPGQVLVKLAAAGMNPMDDKLASGAWRPAPATFPMVLGVDGAGIVEGVGDGVTRFALKEELFGQLLVPPIGAAGTYAEYVAVTAEAPLAPVPEGLGLVEAAAVPTVGGTGLTLVESLEPLEDKTVLIVGAGGGVGTFATQYAVSAGAEVLANARAQAAERMRSYGVAGTIDHTAVALGDAVGRSHPDGIDALIDLVSDADAFAALASLVRPGGSAITTQYVADDRALSASGVRGVNFALRETSEVLARVAKDLVDGRVVPPPITRIALGEVPSVMRARSDHHADGKTVIVLS
ncbi:MAG TPA: NADP-dependent oxidoreductase [Acidimicrobiales bacterium]|nr:NADP-dependent oxidoreductase [Acidimicrobiales bacterium]